MENRHGAYILARYSTDNQNPDSIEVQVEKCTEWCKSHDMPVLDIFADYAISGMRDTRPQYARMIQALQAGGADTVVIYDQSRMFRKLTAWFDFREILSRLGAHVVAVTQPMIGGDLTDPACFLTESTMAVFNQMWCLQTRQKVVAKMRHMATSGQYTGGVPALGYQVVDQHLAVCEPEAAVVREIFELYASGMSYHLIIDQLNEEGHKTKAGNPFGQNSLHDILKNEKYIGVLHYGATKKTLKGTRTAHNGIAEDAIRIENGCPAIVDRDTWDKVQLKMARNQRSQAGRPPLRDYPLKGKAFCALCGSALAVSRSQGKYYYYSCGRKSRNGTCDLPRIGAPKLEHLVADAVRGLIGTQSNINGLIEVMRDQRARMLGDSPDKLGALMEQRAALQKKLEAGTDAILSGLNSPTVRRKINELESEIYELDEEISDLHEDVARVGIADDELRRSLTRLLVDAPADDSAIMGLVARVELGRDDIRVWTLLDADFSGRIDPAEAGAVINIDGDALPAPSIIITAHAAVLKVAR